MKRGCNFINSIKRKKIVFKLNGGSDKIFNYRFLVGDNLGKLIC